MVVGVGVEVEVGVGVAVGLGVTPFLNPVVITTSDFWVLEVFVSTLS